MLRRQHLAAIPPRDLIASHVVQKDNVRPGIQGDIELIEVVHFYLDSQGRPKTSCAKHRVLNSQSPVRNWQCCQMIVFNENAVVKSDAMILAPAAAHSILFKRAPARKRFACVKNPAGSTGNRLDVVPRQCRHAAEMLHKVQCRPFSSQDRSHGTINAC